MGAGAILIKIFVAEYSKENKKPSLGYIIDLQAVFIW
jgi:hypothetical protein